MDDLKHLGQRTTRHHVPSTTAQIGFTALILGFILTLVAFAAAYA